MNEAIRWTNLPANDFVKSYAKKGIKLTRFIIKQLLKKKGFVKRKMAKKGTFKDVANRDEQFKHIAKQKVDFLAKKLPILSIDTKKKEFIGQFYREGQCYCKEAVSVHDRTGGPA